ncbi:MAG: rod shape-determining protein MreD [Arenicella sp.]
MMPSQINPVRLGLILVVCTLFAGILSLINLPDWVFYFRPDWLALVVVYWVLAFPERLSVSYGFFNGLFLDLILVKPLGLNALGFVLLAYLINYWSSQIRALSLWQQCVFLVVLLSVCKLLIGIAAVITADFVFTWFYWYSMIGNFVFWPVVYVLLREIRQSFLAEQRK